MPLTLRRGSVTAITEELTALVRLEVDGLPCISYPRLTGPVRLGDEVLVNEQARILELGSGGFDVLYANLTRGLGLAPEEGAHVMKWPYAPGQLALLHAEEDDRLASALGGMPVVCCTLHSQVVPVCAAIGRPVAYVQVQGGGLAIPLSDAVRALRVRGLIDTTVASGPCFGGDVECVNVASALAWIADRGSRIAVCSVGPGIVGTGTRLGHGALALAEAANAASALGGRAVMTVRESEGDTRARHQGVSHHTQAVLDLCLGDVVVAWPDDVDTSGWEEACAGLPLAHMGRGPDDDAAFFRAAFAAGVVARGLIQ